MADHTHTPRGGASTPVSSPSALHCADARGEMQVNDRHTTQTTPLWMHDCTLYLTPRDEGFA